MEGVKLDSLRHLPYLKVDVLGDRVVNLMPYWDGQRWHKWFPVGDELLPLPITDAVHSDYVAMKPAAGTDLFVPFIDFVWQRASWPEIVPHLSSIINNFHNLGTSLAKLGVFYQQREVVGEGVSLFARTELDYVFVLARSIFDLLQEIIACLWNGRVRLMDESAEARRKARKLPVTFSKVVLRDKKECRSAEQISTEFGLPESFAAVYERFTQFFVTVRDFRDAVVHGIGGRDFIFVTERGFCVNPTDKAFARFTIWEETARYSNHLYSLMPLLSHVILNTIDACNALMHGFAEVVQFPDEIAPSHSVFSRGYHNAALVRAMAIVNGASPWQDSHEPATGLS